MLVYLNGRFVPEAEATVSIFDRSFLYGDGLFEVMRVFRGKPFRWADHMERLRRGAAFVKIQPPFLESELHKAALQLVEQNTLPEALLRITLSRGVGHRGYSPKGADNPTLTMTLHPAPGADGQPPPAGRVITASFRLPANEALAQFKTCNKLPQVMARAEADAAVADEALLLNTNGEIVEGSSSNLFWIAEGKVCTPPLTSGILAGVTRIVVLELCEKLGLPSGEKSITPAALRRAEGVFLSLSSWGIWEVASIDGEVLPRSPVTRRLQEAYASASQGRVS
jgi:branched-chain amino acid aminotransferase